MTRDEIFRRDNYRCVYCGNIFDVDELSVDHVQPRVRGGDRSGGNTVTACRACNTAKGHTRLAHYLAANPVAMNNFFRYATSVWPRHLRAVTEELNAHRS
jgi:5-methylcytosine-specific restriction endonuclease McrA